MLTQPNTNADRPNALRPRPAGVRRRRAHPDGNSTGLRAGSAGRAGWWRCYDDTDAYHHSKPESEIGHYHGRLGRQV